MLSHICHRLRHTTNLAAVGIELFPEATGLRLELLRLFHERCDLLIFAAYLLLADSRLVFVKHTQLYLQQAHLLAQLYVLMPHLRQLLAVGSFNRAIAKGGFLGLNEFDFHLLKLDLEFAVFPVN